MVEVLDCVVPCGSAIVSISRPARHLGYCVVPAAQLESFSPVNYLVTINTISRLSDNHQMFHFICPMTDDLQRL